MSTSFAGKTSKNKEWKILINYHWKTLTQHGTARQNCTNLSINNSIGCQNVPTYILQKLESLNASWVQKALIQALKFPMI